MLMEGMDDATLLTEESICDSNCTSSRLSEEEGGGGGDKVVSEDLIARAREG